MIYKTKQPPVMHILRDAGAAFSIMARIKGIKLRVDAPGETLSGSCGPKRVGQVVRNPLSNALKFTPEGSQIVIRVEPARPAGGPQPADPAESGRVMISGHGQGIGIPEVKLEKVFGKFVQSSRTLTGAGGTGLGFSTCREIIEQQGGRIRA